MILVILFMREYIYKEDFNMYFDNYVHGNIRVEAGELRTGEDSKTSLVWKDLKGASVKALVVKQARDEKVIVFKKKRRQNYRRKNGHRQSITLVKITNIASAKAAETAKSE